MVTPVWHAVAMSVRASSEPASVAIRVRRGRDLRMARSSAGIEA
jgi:hypothetical protein